MTYDFSLVTDVEVEVLGEYPEFSDSYISSAKYKGESLDEDELDKLQDQGYDMNEYENLVSSMNI